MLVYRPRVAIATATIGLFAACSDPVLPTDLRPDGPPEVLAVLVLDDPNGVIETATFCKTQGPNDAKDNTGDPQRPTLVDLPEFAGTTQVCPDDLTMGVPELTDAAPETWYVRVMFDELLDPAIEDLIPILDSTGQPTGNYSGSIASTKPFVLQCADAAGTAVTLDYDGYYQPSGNKFTWPVGPSLVASIARPALVPTQSECTISLNDNIVDKDGNPVPMDQRGPYKFAIAPLTVTAISPGESMDSTMPTTVDPIAAGVDLTFNAPIQVDATGAPTLSTADYAFAPTVANGGVAPEAPEEFFLFADFGAATGYSWMLNDGAMIKDHCGVATTFTMPDPSINTATAFMTNPITLVGVTPSTGSTSTAPAQPAELNFNQYMDDTSLIASEFTISPTPIGFAGPVADASGNVTFPGVYKLGTSYTLTVNVGATIDDCPGGEFGACVKSGTYTITANDMATTTFTTAAQIQLVSSSPNDNDTVTGDASGSNPTNIQLTFNQQMDPTTLTQGTDFTLSPNVALTVGQGVNTGSNAELDLTGDLPPGSYTFTLKNGAAISDLVTPTADVYAQTQDLVITFTVAAPAATGPDCLP